MKLVAQWTMALLTATCLACGGGDASPGGAGSRAAPPATFAGKIVFVRAEGGASTLMVMNADGGDVRSLGVEGLKPDVSPDGHRVAYQRDEDLYVYDLRTGAETPVALAGLNIAASWSPDGGKILFWSDRSGGKDLWVVGADGSNPVRLTDGGGENLEGDWSPDGSRIVFRRNTGDGGDLWVMNSDGSNPTLLLGLSGQEGNPQWSPDGTRIAFDRVGRDGGVASVDVFVVNADGTHPVRVTSGTGEDWAPRWSPDGSRLVFFTFRGGADDGDIYTVRPDGTGLAPLLAGPAYDDGPTYGPAD